MFLCWPDKNYVYILILDVLTSNILTALNCAIFLWQSLPGKEVDEVKNQTNGLSIMTLCLKRAFKKASLKQKKKKKNHNWLTINYPEKLCILSTFAYMRVLSQ